jgi:tetratricopeptide (TPR) repeat protein
MRMLRSAAPEQQPALRQRGLAAARLALDLDPDQPDAQAALLTVMPVFRNWLAFERASTGPYRRHPDHLELCILHATLLAEVGRLSELLAPCMRAVKRAPVHPDVQSFYALTLLELGRLEQGEAHLERCFGLWPRRIGIFSLRFNYLLYNHRADEALRMIRDQGRLPAALKPEFVELADLRAAAIVDGRREQVRTALDQLEAGSRESAWMAKEAIMFAVNRGDLDRAFRILDALYFNRGFRVAGSHRVTDFLFRKVMEPLRRDARFALLTRSLGLDEYWQKSGSRHLVSA